MVGAYVNPLDQAALYRQSRLGSILSGQGIHVDPSIQQAQSQVDPQAAQSQAQFQQGLQDISSSSSSQNQNYLAAVQKRAQMDEQARQQKLWDQQMAKISAAQATGVPSVTGYSNSGPLVGPYKLTAQANAAYNNLNAAYKAAGFGNLGILSGGRTYAEQQRLYNGYINHLPGYNLAAKPGTSVHETGRAVDFSGPAHDSGTAAHNWLVQNSQKYGWTWTGKNFGESWHFEYTG